MTKSTESSASHASGALKTSEECERDVRRGRTKIENIQWMFTLALSPPRGFTPLPPFPPLLVAAMRIFALCKAIHIKSIQLKSENYIEYLLMLRLSLIHVCIHEAMSLGLASAMETTRTPNETRCN